MWSAVAERSGATALAFKTEAQIYPIAERAKAPATLRFADALHKDRNRFPQSYRPPRPLDS
jgi:hypothetical protein